jgi:flagellar biosynthetic protein FliR
MDIFHFNPADILSFFLTMFRISIILFLLPFFGGQSIPNTVKAALVLVLSLAVWPALSFPAELFPSSPVGVGVMLLGEAILGFFLGLAVRLLFAAIQFGGQLMGFSMGFSMINVIDPVTGVSEVVTAHFLYMCSLLVFLTIGGHLYLLSGLADSFRLAPPGSLLISPEIGRQYTTLSAQIFSVAVRIAAPVTVAIFMVDLALGLISKVAPQLHVLMLGFPIKISVGLIFLGMIFILIAQYVQDYVVDMGPLLRHILRALGGAAGV